jgi:beta-lactamase class A
MRRNPLLITAGVLVLTVSAVIAVKYVNTYESSASAGGQPVAVSPSTDASDGSGDPGTDPSAEAVPGADDPAQQARFQAAADLVQKAKGHLGVIVHDRKSGAEWRAGEVDHPTWTASTIKLAIAENLLERSRNGEIKLDTTARKNIADMLDTSSDLAADALWDRFGKDAYVPWFQQQYGMANLQFQAGAVHKWNQLKGTADDLIHLMTYVLDRADPADRDYLMAAMRRAGTLQHWGVWAAGPDKQPGVKNGWSLETDDRVKHWITHSVGFAGPDAQYAIVIMFDQPAGGTVNAGVHTVSDVVATVFGAKVPADITVPPASTGG